MKAKRTYQVTVTRQREYSATIPPGHAQRGKALRPLP
jgi:hypothetical protein